MAKRIVETLDQIPEPLRPEYEEREDGFFVLKLEDVDVDGLVNTVGALRKSERELKQLKTKLGNRQVDEVIKDLSRIPELEEKAKRTKDFSDKSEEERFAAMTAEMRQRYESQVQGLTSSLSEKDGLIKDLGKKVNLRAIENALDKAIIKVGIEPEFHDDVMLRAGSFDVIIDDTTGREYVALLDPTGNPMRSAKDPTRYKDPEEWLVDQAKTKPKWFKGSQGANTPAASSSRRAPAGVMVIDADDSEAIGRNLQAIADGKAVVRRS